MNKFIRFIVAAILYILCWIAMFLVIPTIAWIFGAEFLDVAQSGAYCALMVIMGNILLGMLFHGFFDKEFNFKP